MNSVTSVYNLSCQNTKMASDRTDDSNSRTSSLPSHCNSSNNGDCITHCEQKGWLMKRSRMSNKWRKRWFYLKNTDLHYGETPENTSKKIPLMNADIREIYIDKKHHAFRIKPRETGRIHYMQAENELSQNDWMQAIYFAKAAGHNGDESQACVLQ